MPHNVVTLKQHPGLTLANGQPKFVPDMATPVEIMTNAQRLALATAPFGLVVIESDTISDNKAYIGTGNGTNWLGPFTAAQVVLGSGGGSGVPGTPVAQPTVTASTTASAIISLSQPAKGVRLVVVNKDAGTATTPTAADGYFNVVFDPPSDLIKADWLNETLAGPRHRVTTKQALEIYFQDSAGTALTVSTFAHAASQTNANISLAVEAIV